MKLDVASSKLVMLAFLISTIALLAGFYVQQSGNSTLTTAYNYMLFDSIFMALIGLLWKDFGKAGIEIPYRGALISMILLGTGAILVGIIPLLGTELFMYGQGIYLVGFLLGITPIFMPKK